MELQGAKQLEHLMQLSRAEINTMDPIDRNAFKHLVDLINITYIEERTSDLKKAIDWLDKKAEAYGNRCYFCNESETASHIENDAKWYGSVDLINNSMSESHQRGNLICNSNKCQDEYDAYMDQLIYGDYNPNKN